MKLQKWVPAGLFLSTSLCGTAFAATTVKPVAPKFPAATVEVFNDSDAIRLSETELKEQTEQAFKRAKRSLAGAAGEGSMSPAMIKLRDAVLAVNDSVELDALLEGLNTKYVEFDKKLSAAKEYYREADRDYWYFAAEILPVRCLKGITYRFLPLAEKSSVVDSTLVSFMFRMAQDMQILSPQISDLVGTEEIKAAKAGDHRSPFRAAFDYLTLPYDGALLFSDAYQFQAHLWNACATELKKAASRQEMIRLETPIVLDNKMFFGVGSFPDELDRFKLVGEADRHLSLAAKYAGMHAAAFFRAYSMGGYFQLQKALAKLTVTDAFPNFLTPGRGYLAVDGVGLMQRADTIRSFKDTFLLYKDPKNKYADGQWLMTRSFALLSRSIQELGLAWDELKGRTENKQALLNPAIFNAAGRGLDAVIGNDASLGTWMRIAKGGDVAMHSRLTNRMVTMNMQYFYDHAPDDLKDLLPLPGAAGFDTTSPRLYSHSFKIYKTNQKGEKVLAEEDRFKKYRNYFYQGAKKWDVGVYSRLFPQMKNGEDLPLYIRTATEGWGGTFVMAPLMPFVR